MASSSGNLNIARRYATAFFELAREQSAIDGISDDLKVISTLLAAGGDFEAFVQNPVLRRDDQARALVAVSRHLKLSSLTEKFLGTLAQRRRLAALKDIIMLTEALISLHKGESKAEVITARALEPAQLAEITAGLKKALGAAVHVDVTIDPSIMGGLIVKVGSKMIDSSVQTKLERLHRALKNTNASSDQKKMKEVA